MLTRIIRAKPIHTMFIITWHMFYSILQVCRYGFHVIIYGLQSSIKDIKIG